MFVFKAAVVGAGTMGGQIAQTIAAAGFPVVLKDIGEELVQAGLDEARNVTAGQVGKLVERGKLTAEQGDAQIAEIVGRIEGTTSYASFGDVDFVIEAVPERMEIKQAVFAELDAATPGHAILASNTSSLSITEIGEATLRPDKVVGFHYFYPASVLPLIEVIEGDETSPETVTAAVTFAQAIRKQPITCAEVPGFVVNRILNAGISEIWRAQEEQRPLDQADRRGRRRGGRACRWGPTSSSTCSGSTRCCTSPSTSPSPTATSASTCPRGCRSSSPKASSARRPAATASTTRRGSPTSRARASPTCAELVELLTLKTFVEACLVLEEGVATHRDIDFGMMAGAGLDPRRGLMPPFMKRRRGGPRHGPRAPGERPASATASASPRPRSCAAWSPRAASGRRAARASTPTRSPTPSSPARCRQARDAPGRRRDRVAGQRPDELDRPRGDRGSRQGVGAGQGRRPAGARARDRLLQPLPLQRRRRHQGVHARWTRRAGAAGRRRPRAVPRAGQRAASPRSPPSTASPSAAAASWRWPATCASPRARRCSASPRSSSGSSPASAAPSACRASSARARRWR